MTRRSKIPKAIVEDILIECRRRCCLCYHFDGDLNRRDGQIAHIDRDATNSAKDNLVWLCLSHHDEYDRLPSKTRRITPGEVTAARQRLLHRMKIFPSGSDDNTRIVELTLAEGISHFTREDQERLMLAIGELASLGSGVKVVYKKRGSIKLGLKVTGQQAKVLRGIFEAGEFEEINISNVEVRPDLVQANLERADLRQADLSGLLLASTNLSHADLSGADLDGANLTGADLSSANLSGANLRGANLTAAILVHSNLAGATFGGTILAGVDLGLILGLDDVEHLDRSYVSTDTLAISKGHIPKSFLRGCGFNDWEIEASRLWDPELSPEERTACFYEIDRLLERLPVQISPLFISYSQRDSRFVEGLLERFDAMGIRYWRDIHDLRAGRLETQIDQAIRLNPVVLLVLSHNSVESDWVEWEVNQARKLEMEFGRDVLCPVAIDDAWKTSSWPAPLRRQIEQYNILDFSAWEHEQSFEAQLGKLLDGLKLFYRREKST